MSILETAFQVFSCRGKHILNAQCHHGEKETSKFPGGHGKALVEKRATGLRMRILPYIYLLCQSGALFTRPPLEPIYDVIITPLTTTETSLTTVTSTLHKEHSSTEFSRSSLITMPPISRNPLELRQKCFDDRGFSVDCATWTGYYYTWGPPVSSNQACGQAKDQHIIQGDPYRGGPGDSGGSRHTGSAASTVMPLAICYIILMNLITLWAALSIA